MVDLCIQHRCRHQGRTRIVEMRNIPDAGRIGPDFLDIDGQTVRLFRRLGVPFEVSTIFRYSGGGEINKSVEQATLRSGTELAFSKTNHSLHAAHAAAACRMPEGCINRTSPFSAGPGISMDQCAVNLRGDRQT